MSYQEFIAMNGYGEYVWGSYGIGLIVFVGLFLMVRIQRKSLIKQLSRRYRLQQDKSFKEQQKQ